MKPFVEKAAGESLYRSTIGIVFFGLIIVGVRVRRTTSGGDVSIIILGVAIGVES